MLKELFAIGVLSGVVLHMSISTYFEYKSLTSQDEIICIDYQKKITRIKKDDLNISFNKNRIYINDKKLTFGRCF